MRDFELPGRSLAVGRNGMAATSHPTATLTAIEVLKAGGAAIDAAVAACAVQCVVEAGSTGIGGDCFVLMAPKGGDQVLAYNGSGRTPAALTAAALAERGVTTLERSSPHVVTVPGAIDAWTRLVADHGRMSMAELLAPAIGLARDGYGITPRVAADAAGQRELLAADPTARRTFLVGDEAPKVGSIQRQPELAATLETIGREGRDGFYRGAVAQDMVERLSGLGGFHTLADFESAAGEYVEPVTATYRGWTVHECPPNGQGMIALMILKILERFKPASDPLDLDGLHVEVEATRLAYAARDAYLADMSAAKVPVEYLLSDEVADRLAAQIDPKRALDPLPVLDGVEHRDTVYISVVDKDRNAVSFINSIFHPYGSGLVAPRSGVLLHNRGQSFSLAAGHPNQIGPRKRPMHTIIPGMVTRDGRAVMPFGVMGGHYQAMGHAHLLSKLFDHGLDLQSAMDLPRLFPLPGTKTIEMEGRLRTLRGEGFSARGFTVAPPKSAIGGSQAIWIDWENGTLLGGSDHRKDGCALGW
ncbi:gamma-glutamyltransferase family protein [Bosea sp. (in: a-proteobacteria)]|uniref:gamma-glutamyltransferase family protein n=1 Tax=Bosea sp. (in: a-proteobacteria) TaxID=1871050 RepID=UPI0011F5942E|nr:gamma-glutamyltransferase family protein [Bosea sp. (in: a-proteobacteria)]TAJ33770.1 MAG: gamma-glutamyltransferase family protein [Bosea sp. (in: a-proteobacteria)]